ncbi:hypothetical protein [Streptomyces sp. NPDC059247]|uniref:hypothetical protein n=1 Tax=Streptomyces sp. NPDC059247 TaxID=3346790 RepID=UPI0036A66668
MSIAITAIADVRDFRLCFQRLFYLGGAEGTEPSPCGGELELIFQRSVAATELRVPGGEPVGPLRVPGVGFVGSGRRSSISRVMRG